MKVYEGYVGHMKVIKQTCSFTDIERGAVQQFHTGDNSFQVLGKRRKMANSSQGNSYAFSGIIISIRLDTTGWRR